MTNGHRKPVSVSDIERMLDAIELQAGSLYALAATLELMANRIQQGKRPSDDRLCIQLNGLARLICEHTALVASASSGDSPTWH